MAQLQANGGSQPGKQKQRRKLVNLKVDMTPMVDLGFLLITFFIITTTMTESKGADLIMPKEGKAMGVKESRALTLLLHADEKVYAYEGSWESALANSKIHAASFYDKQTIRNIIKTKQAQMGKGKDGLMVLIKPAEQSRYSNVVDALDEMLLHNVKRYAVVDAGPVEEAYLKQH